MHGHSTQLGALCGVEPRLQGMLGIFAGALLLVVLLEAALRRWVLRRPVDWRGVAASLADAIVRRGVELVGLTLTAPLPAFAFSHRLATIPMTSAATCWTGRLGSALIVFDRLFGTFVAERPDIEIRYGLVHPVTSHDPVRIAFHEWLAMGRAVVAARGVRQRLRVIFGPP
jgi:hypothetical protein